MSCTRFAFSLQFLPPSVTEPTHHISRTNHSFQDILRSPSSSSIWRVAFEREDEIPRCLPDISELEGGGFVVRKADLSSEFGSLE